MGREIFKKLLNDPPGGKPLGIFKRYMV